MDRASDEARAREARAILNRVRQETEPQVGAGLASGVWSHFAARDADPADRMEVLGARIGRLAGLVAVLVLGAALVLTLLRG